MKSGTNDMGKLCRDDILRWFTHHPANTEQYRTYELIRNRAYDLAMLIAKGCPPSADRTDAIRKLREVVMTAIASIACQEHQEGRNP